MAPSGMLPVAGLVTSRMFQGSSGGAFPLDPVHAPLERAALHPRAGHRARAGRPCGDARPPHVRAAEPGLRARRRGGRRREAQGLGAALLVHARVRRGRGARQAKAFGAGLLSSFGELGGLPARGRSSLRPPRIEATPYDPTQYQNTYFVAPSLTARGDPGQLPRRPGEGAAGGLRLVGSLFRSRRGHGRAGQADRCEHRASGAGPVAVPPARAWAYLTEPRCSPTLARAGHRSSRAWRPGRAPVRARRLAPPRSPGRADRGRDRRFEAPPRRWPTWVDPKTPGAASEVAFELEPRGAETLLRITRLEGRRAGAAVGGRRLAHPCRAPARAPQGGKAPGLPLALQAAARAVCRLLRRGLSRAFRGGRNWRRQAVLPGRAWAAEPRVSAKRFEKSPLRK